MADKNVIVKESLEHSGIFNFSEFYEYTYRWFKDEGYGVVEEKYSEKVSETTRDIGVEWKCAKGLSDYFKVEISVKLEVSGAKDVEVEIEGKRKKMNKGKVKADFKGVLIKDPESKWESSPFNRFIRAIYEKYVIPGQVCAQEDKVQTDIKNVKECLKSFLELQGRR